MSDKKPVRKTVKKKAKPKNMKLSKAMEGNENAVGNNGGRPTKYDDSFIERLDEFFNIEDSPFREVVGDKGNVQLIPRRMPTLERFAVLNGVGVTTLYGWAHETTDDGKELLRPEFSKAYTRAKEAQLAFMIEGGVAGALNPSFGGLFLKNAHGWKDKTEQEVTHSGAIDMSQVDADLKRAAEERARRKEEMREKGLIGKFET